MKAKISQPENNSLLPRNSTGKGDNVKMSDVTFSSQLQESMAKGDKKSDTIVKSSQPAAMPTKEEFVSYLNISRQPKSISDVLSDIDISSPKVSFSSIKSPELAALRERARNSNITYNMPQTHSSKKPEDSKENLKQGFKTVVNPVTGKSLGLVGSQDGSFYPVSGVSPKPSLRGSNKFHPRTHNAVGVLTEEFEDFIVVSGTHVAFYARCPEKEGIIINI